MKFQTIKNAKFYNIRIKWVYSITGPILFHALVLEKLSNMNLLCLPDK